jgi:hypothetical protein
VYSDSDEKAFTTSANFPLQVLSITTMSANSNNKIFVSVPAYDEPFIKATVEDAYEKAEHPDLLYFGIYNQKSSPDLFEDFSMFPNVRVVNAVYPVPPGVSIARLNASMLHIDEEYYYQIDAHNFFAQNWDTLLRQDYKLLAAHVEKPVIASSFYWHDLSDYEESSQYRYTFYLSNNDPRVGRPLKIDNRGDTTFDTSRDDEPRFLGKFQEHFTFFGGGGIFTSSDIIYDVAYEPFTMYIPEQELFALRACTRGYRIFSNGMSVTSSLSKCQKNGDGFRSDVFPTSYQALIESKTYECRGRWANDLSLEYLAGKRFGFAGAPNEELYEKYVEDSGIDFRKCKRY